MEEKPIPRRGSNLLQRSRFLEQMRRPRNHDELNRGVQSRLGHLVQADDDVIALADEKERGGPHARQRITSKVGPAPARHDGGDTIRSFGGSDQRCPGTGAGPKQADR
jgi:hypothetical protein